MNEDEKYEKESGVATYYRSYRILIWFLIIILIIVAILKFTSIGNKPDNPSPESIVVTVEPNSNVSVGIGNTISLNAKVNVENAAFVWTSSDPGIARVSNGNVTGVSYGKATIIAAYYDSQGNKYTASVDVSVVEGNPSIDLNSINFPSGDLYMPAGKEYKLALILNPSNALINDKMFISTDERIITVSNDGVVKAIREGNAKVIATVNGKYKASIDVYVGKEYKTAEIVLSPASLSFNNDNRKIKVGSSEKLGYSVTPSNADRSRLTWTSSDFDVVSVDQSGKITAKKEGKAIISISSINGKRDDIVVEVYNDIIEVQDIMISTTTLNMETGKTEVITPVVSPSNASNKGLSYSSVDPSIVSITVNGSGTNATLSALKEGSTTIIIQSGKVEKRITVNVTGDGNDIDEGGNLPTTIRVRSNKNNLAKSYEEAKKIPVPGASTVTITMQMGVGKLKYCFNKYGSSPCTPATEFYVTDDIIIPNGAIYELRVIKYDYDGNEIKSTSTNYYDGMLHYFINTLSDEKVKQYTVTGAYENDATATLYPKQLNNKVSIKVNDSTRHLNICYTTNGTCTPTTRVNSSYSITLNKTGTWRIFVIEYDQNGKKIGNTEVYYAYIKDTSATSAPVATPVYNGEVKLSNIQVLNDNNGKYLSIDVESNVNFNNTRFCYTVVNKDVMGTCNLDIKSSSVPYYNNGSIVRPKEEMKTYYATLTSTKKYTFKFYLDGLDQLYNASDTTRDVIFEFAVKSSSGFTDPIKIRSNMTSRSGNSSYWNNTFIK